jgi:hypothetical protein
MRHSFVSTGEGVASAYIYMHLYMFFFTVGLGPTVLLHIYFRWGGLGSAIGNGRRTRIHLREVCDTGPPPDVLSMEVDSVPTSEVEGDSGPPPGGHGSTSGRWTRVHLSIHAFDGGGFGSVIGSVSACGWISATSPMWLNFSHMRLEI